MAEENDKQDDEKIRIGYNLSSKWVDNIHIAEREDDIVLIRLSTSFPEGEFEQTRYMTSKDQLKDMVDTISTVIGYYPEPPEEET